VPIRKRKVGPLSALLPGDRCRHVNKAWMWESLASLEKTAKDCAKWTNDQSEVAIGVIVAFYGRSIFTTGVLCTSGLL